MARMWNEKTLDGQWNLYCVPNSRCTEKVRQASCEEELRRAGMTPVPGTVPGTMETDLMKNGLLEDIYTGSNILRAQELEDRHLWYCRRFLCREDGDWHLNFEGIDTVADIYLNGAKIQSSDNMLIAHHMPATGIRSGENELMVHIFPTALEARKRENGPGAMNFLEYSGDTLQMRKAAHMSGWDIMPRVVSAGLWRSVWLYRIPADGIDAVYAATTGLQDGRAKLHIYFKTHVSRDLLRGYTIRVTGQCQDSRFSVQKKLRHTEGYIECEVDSPRLWWTRNMGEPSLYTLQAELLWEGAVLDTYRTRFGIRTVQLLRSDYTDAEGNGEFCFLLNGEKMFVLGTNWVPVDALHDRDRERLPRCLQLLEDVGCNMVRMWGGNVYEDESFYDFCDEKGIAVWQDFAMGCAQYPQTPRLQEALREEVRSVAEKYRQHPSLFLWAGDNECDCSLAQWSGLARNPTMNRLTRQVIPEALQQYDPFREYLPSSPYISDEAYRTGNRDNTPEQHLWGPRKYYKADFYAKAIAHFASETGYHGCPAPGSVEKFISPANWFPWQDNDEWKLHATCMDTEEDPYAYRIPLMASQIEVLFGCVPENLREFALASQISQAEADKYFVERFRWGKWRRTGIIWWNLIDGWPQFSDAVVDYYFTKKLAYYVLQRVSSPVCLMIREEPDQDARALTAVNDTLGDAEVGYRITDLSDGGTVQEGTVKIPANSAVTLPLAMDMTRQGMLLLTWQWEGRACQNHYLMGKPPYRLSEVWQWYRQAGLPLPEGF